MIAGIIKLLSLAGLTYLSFCLILYFSQDKLVFPDAGGIDFKPSDYGFTYDDDYFSDSTGNRLNGWFIHAPGDGDTLLFFHGNGENISHCLEHARFYHQLGMNVFLVDYSGYGNSAGKISEETSCANALAAWNHLTQTKGIPQEKIVISGRSIGGGIAANLASRVKPKALIIEASFSSLKKLVEKLYFYMPVGLLLKYRYETDSIINDIHCPILFIHAINDEIVPKDHSEKLYSLYHNNRKKLVLLKNGGHNDYAIRSSEQYNEGIRNFLEEIRL